MMDKEAIQKTSISLPHYFSMHGVRILLVILLQIYYKINLKSQVS